MKIVFGAAGMVLNLASSLLSAAIVVGAVFAGITLLRGKSVAKEFKKASQKLKK